ncbi:MAG: OsmC family protein [Chloroflexi bacterium]|nr:OsmC family protein [Chloroflexota bacterium]
MTQIERYSQLMKVKITKVRAEASVHFEISGSVLAGTILAGAPKVETRYEIESPDDPAKVAAMLRNAKNGCWVRAAVINPTPFEETLILNGEPFSLD